MKHLLKRFIPRCLLALALLVLGGISQQNSLRAQDTLGFSQIGFAGMPDTVNNGNSTLVGAFLENRSLSTTFNDSVLISGYVDTSAQVPFSFPAYDTITILPGDTQFVIMPIAFTDPSLSGFFRIGSNTIVIWPIALHSSFETGDSLTATVFILPTGLGPEPHNNEEVRCYPVPSNGPLFIQSLSPTLRPAQAVVRDVNGRVVAESKTLAAGIDTEPWPPGVYFIEVTFDNGTMRIYKVMRQ
jgi:hypothetical protein